MKSLLISFYLLAFVCVLNAQNNSAFFVGNQDRISITDASPVNPNAINSNNIVKEEKPDECKAPLDTISTIEIIHFEENIVYSPTYYGPTYHFDILKPRDRELPSIFQKNLASNFYFYKYVSPQDIRNLTVQHIVEGCFDIEKSTFTSFLHLNGFESLLEKHKTWDEFDAKENKNIVVDTLISISEKYHSIIDQLYKNDYPYKMRLFTWAEYHQDIIFFPVLSKKLYNFDKETLLLPILPTREWTEHEESFKNAIYEYKGIPESWFPGIHYFFMNYVEEHKYFPLSKTFYISNKDAKKIFGGIEKTYVETIIDLIPNSDFIETDLSWGQTISTSFNIIKVTKNFYRENQWDGVKKRFTALPVYQIVIESTDDQPLGNITNYNKVLINSLNRYVDIDSLIDDIQPSFLNYTGKYYQEEEGFLRLTIDANKNPVFYYYELSSSGKEEERIDFINFKVNKGEISCTGTRPPEQTPNDLKIKFVKYGKIKGILLKSEEGASLFEKQIKKPSPPNVKHK